MPLSPPAGIAWPEAAARPLPAARVSLPAAVARAVNTVVSPQGIEFSLRSGATSRFASETDPPASLWLALLIEGRVQVDDESRQDLAPGDLLYGPTDEPGLETPPADLRWLHVLLPARLLHPRQLDVSSLRLGGLPGARGVNRLFVGLLQSIAEGWGELEAEQLRPFEAALIEFVVASLRSGTAARNPGGARAGRFQRLCEAIEARLSDCELSLQRFAAEQHASSRYIQKLFGEAGSSFSGYLRERRLERCRADLASKACEGLSISEICFRWGFNDAAHFSRSFRLQFGTTPREYRQALVMPERRA